MTELHEATNDELLAEMAKRMGAKLPRRGGFKKTKLEWAQSELNAARTALEQVEQNQVPAGAKTARKMENVEALRDKITKFERLVKRYTESVE